MIWFFGTSHTDGFADGQKHLDQLTYTEIVGEKTKHDYINFGTSGINNLLIYKFMKIMLESKKYKKPDIIIIEPRSYYDYVSFPRLFNDGKMTYDEITWRNKNDAYYTGYHNDYVKMHTAWQLTTGNSKRARNNSMHMNLKRLSQDDKILPENLKDYVQVLKDNEPVWVNRQPMDYSTWTGSWYDSYMEILSRSLEKHSDYLVLRLEQEMNSMIYLAKQYTDKVGYMFWDIWREPNHYSIQVKNSLNHLKQYDILGQTVHELLEEKHPVEYKVSKQTYKDDHLGPEAHIALAPYITKWIKMETC